MSDFSLFEDFRQLPSGGGAGSLHVFGSLASPHAPVGWLQRMVVNTTCEWGSAQLFQLPLSVHGSVEIGSGGAAFDTSLTGGSLASHVTASANIEPFGDFVATDERQNRSGISLPPTSVRVVVDWSNVSAVSADPAWAAQPITASADVNFGHSIVVYGLYADFASSPMTFNQSLTPTNVSWLPPMAMTTLINLSLNDGMQLAVDGSLDVNRSGVTYSTNGTAGSKGSVGTVTITPHGATKWLEPTGFAGRVGWSDSGLFPITADADGSYGSSRVVYGVYADFASSPMTFNQSLTPTNVSWLSPMAMTTLINLSLNDGMQLAVDGSLDVNRSGVTYSTNGTAGSKGSVGTVTITPHGATKWLEPTGFAGRVGWSDSGLFPITADADGSYGSSRVVYGVYADFASSPMMFNQSLTPTNVSWLGPMAMAALIKFRTSPPSPPYPPYPPFLALPPPPPLYSSSPPPPPPYSSPVPVPMPPTTALPGIDTFPVKSVNLGAAPAVDFYVGPDVGQYGLFDVHPVHGALLADGSYVMAGKAVEADGSSVKRMFCIKLSSVGAVDWVWGLPVDGKNDAANAVLQLPGSGDIIVVGYQTGQSNAHQRSITKLRVSDGTEVWSALWPSTDSATPNGAWEMISLMADNSAVLLAGLRNGADQTEFNFKSYGESHLTTESRCANKGHPLESPLCPVGHHSS